MSNDPTERAAASTESQKSRPVWRRGWKRRVITWGVVGMILGAIVGSSEDLAEALHANLLALQLLLLGWFGGALGRLAIEWRQAVKHG